MYARWVPRELKDREQMNRMGLSLQRLLQYAGDGEDTLNRIVTGDESWVHYYQPESERVSVLWKHPSSLSANKCKVRSSAEKVLTVCWDSQGVLLAYFSESRWKCGFCIILWSSVEASRFNSQKTRRSTGKRGVASSWQCPRPHTAWATQERIHELQLELLEHPLYRPDLAPSDFHVFGFLKYHLGEKRRCGSGWDNSQEAYPAGFDALLRDRTSVSMLEDMPRNKCCFHVLYVLYPFVTYLVALPRVIQSHWIYSCRLCIDG
jgi:histone-lysine N-methyltransferase SETMAR